MNESVLNNIVKFEYLSNLVKLQYLRDCFKEPINKRAISKLIGSESIDEINNAKILHSDYGRAFLVYLNGSIYKGGGKGNIQTGLLIEGIDPKESREVKELYEVNRLIKEEICKSDKWFQIFCEYVLVKTSIHELIVDISEKNGVLDLTNLIKISKMKSVEISNLREVVICSLRMGLDLLSEDNGREQVSHLKECKYTEFMAKREEWYEGATYALSIAKENMNRNRLTLVTQWDKYSMCAFDCGPVFLRKKREPLVSKLCCSFSEYSKWDENKALKDKMKEIIEKDVDILIGRYSDSDYFGNENDTVEFFQENREFVENIEKIEDELKSKWERLNIDQGRL